MEVGQSRLLIPKREDAAFTFIFDTESDSFY